MRLLALVLVALATPALAQSSARAPAVQAAPTVDPALVGEWTLSEVVDPGSLDDYGVDVQAVTCVFTADGQAEVSMTAEQDGDPMSRRRAFGFEAAGGTLTEEGGDVVYYRVLAADELELVADGMVIHLLRADA